MQKASAVHAEILISSSFDKKYTQAAAFALEKEIRAIITSYELHSHSILPNFQTLLEYVDILHLETEKDM